MFSESIELNASRDSNWQQNSADVKPIVMAAIGFPPPKEVIEISDESDSASAQTCKTRSLG